MKEHTHPSIRRVTEAEELREIIRLVLNVDVKTDQTRKRDIVNAKMIYAHILRKNDWTLTYIGRSINRDHTTILHYLTSIEGYMKSDTQLVRSYDKVYTEFCVNNDPIYYKSSDNLKKEVIALRIKNKALELQNQELTKETLNNKRLDRIFSLVEQKTPLGTEQLILSRLNAFFQDVYNL